MKFALENWFPENYAILDTICLQSGFFKIIKLGLVISALLLEWYFLEKGILGQFCLVNCKFGFIVPQLL
jgi:hypothetical protein